MDREFFERKVSELSDDKLLDLLKIRQEANQEIIELATREARKRGLPIPDAPIPTGVVTPMESDTKKLDKWNWGAFLLAPYWTLANKLEIWTILMFIPGVNVVAVIYLGFKGNRLAYGKSNLKNIDEFMTLQRQWSSWGIRIFWIGTVGLIIWLIVSTIVRN